MCADMVVHKQRSAVEAWGPVSPAPAPPSPPGRPKSSISQPQVVYHFSPAPYAVRQEIKRLTRPKSTPAQLARLEEEMVRPHTVGYCDRLDQLEYEPTRRHNLEAHLPIRKSRSQGSKRPGNDSPLIPYHNLHGFEFSKNREKIEVKIRTEDFFNRPEPEVKQVRKSHLDPATEALIAQLQEQVNDLTVYLEEERLNHRDTIKRADEILRDKMAAILQEHDEEVKTLKEDSAQALSDMDSSYTRQLHEQETSMQAQIDKLKTEIEFLQSAFESFKTSLHNETTEKMKLREEELSTQHEDELETKLMELKTRMLNERAVEKNNILKDHAKKLERIDQDHQREIESLTHKFAANALELERLTGIQKTYEEMRREHQQLTKKHKAITDKLSAVATELSDSKIKLLEYEASFHARVQQVDERYKSEIHNLMTENTELRRSYMRKCAELYDAKVKYERMIEQKDLELKTLKEGPPEEVVTEKLDPHVQEVYEVIERRYSFPMTNSESQHFVQESRPPSAIGEMVFNFNRACEASEPEVITDDSEGVPDEAIVDEPVIEEID